GSPWIPECRGIRHAEHLDAKLKLEPFGHAEVAEEAAVHVEDTRSAQDVAAAVTEPNIGHGLECQRIEVRLSDSVPAENFDLALDLIGGLGVAWRVHRRSCSGDG